MAEQQAEPDTTNQPLQVDPSRVLHKLQQLDANLVQLAILQVVVEDKEAVISELRSKLVEVSSGRGAHPTP